MRHSHQNLQGSHRSIQYKFLENTLKTKPTEMVLRLSINRLLRPGGWRGGRGGMNIRNFLVNKHISKGRLQATEKNEDAAATRVKHSKSQNGLQVEEQRSLKSSRGLAFYWENTMQGVLKVWARDYQSSHDPSAAGEAQLTVAAQLI